MLVKTLDEVELISRLGSFGRFDVSGSIVRHSIISRSHGIFKSQLRRHKMIRHPSPFIAL